MYVSVENPVTQEIRNYETNLGRAYKDNKIKEDRLEQDIRRDNEEYLDAEGDDEMEL